MIFNTILPILSRRGTQITNASVIAITEQAADRVFQRVGTSKTITFAGVYTGSVTNVEIQIIDAGSSAVLVAWATLVASPSGGTFSGALSVPQYDGWMKWQVRFSNNHAVIATSTNQFGVGALILLTGQSNVSNMWELKLTNTTPNANTRRYRGNGWKTVNAASVSGEIAYPAAQGGEGIVQLVNSMHSLLGVNIGVLEYAVSGTHSSAWAQGGAQYVQTAGPGASAPFGITYADVGGDCELQFHGQGEGDAAAGESPTLWLTNTQSMRNGIQTLTRTPLPVTLELIPWTFFSGTDQSWTDIRSQQLNFITNNSPYSFLASSNFDERLSSDGLHIYASYQPRVAMRIAQGYGFYRGTYTYGATGPIATTVKWAAGSPSNLTMAITPDPGATLQDGSGGTGTSLNGFRVLNAGTPLTISSTIISGNNVVLTMSAPIVLADILAGNIKVDYEFGKNPHNSPTASPATPNLANLVFDSNIPTGDTIGTPMQPTNGLITVTQ